MRDILEKGLKKMGLDVDASKTDKLEQYLNLLSKWNKAYNLTAIKDMDKMVVYHVLDSASVYPYIKGQQVLDVGTGAGMPGLILAILSPSQHFTLLDSNGKKTRFLEHVKREMGLNNVTIINDRVEKVPSDPLYDCITSRAFASLVDMVKLTRHLLSPNGTVAAMKGPKALLEVEQAGLDLDKVERVKLTVPYLDEARELLLFKL